ncbi:MAG TPA: glycosyl hydrolase family 28 protein [Chitinophagaceae bacterium]
MKKIAPLLVACLYTGALFCQQKTYDITAFGAKGDGKTPNTLAIQAAIDKATASGGGKVVVPAGNFVSGVINIKSGVELYLAPGASILGSTKRLDYGPKDASALIVASNQHDIAITGKGTINGRALQLLDDINRMLNAGTLEDPDWKTVNPWHQVRTNESNRPKILEFRDCRNIRVKGITLKDGLCWIQNYKNCSNLIIDSIRVESTTYWNNDGIDITDCKDVRITHSFINAADDGICLKSEDRNSRCENVYIAHCTVRSSASAIKFGTASVGGFKKVTIRDIKVYDTYRSAVALECVDGGQVEDIDIRNVKATNTGNAIFIRLGHRNTDSVIGRLRHVYFGNITAEIPRGKPDKGYRTEGPPLKYPHNVFPASITGLPGHPVEDVVLENIKMVYEGGASKDTAYVGLDALNTITENVPGYPEFSMFGELPAWGLYVRHVNGLQLKNIELRFKKTDFRTACVFDDVKNLKLDDLRILSNAGLPVLLLNNTPSPSMNKLQLPADPAKAIRIQ